MKQDSLTKTAYNHLQQQILSGELAAGSIISESRLASELGFSRTPVGEAIQQLVHEGLVEQIPRYGTVVREIDRREIEELYELREALESYAAARAAERITQPQIAQLKLLCARIEQIAKELEAEHAEALIGEMLQSFLAADMAFHILVVRASGNERILKAIRETRTISQIFRIRRQRHDLDLVYRACDHHGRILRALQQRDGQAAAAHMAEHIRTSKNETLASIREQRKETELNPAFYRELPGKLAEELRRLEDEA
jgi:DNA-binding GntR family transcriptional regulator